MEPGMTDNKNTKQYLEFQASVIYAFFSTWRTKSEEDTLSEIYPLLLEIYRQAFNDGYKTCKSNEDLIKQRILDSLQKVKTALSETYKTANQTY